MSNPIDMRAPKINEIKPTWTKAKGELLLISFEKSVPYETRARRLYEMTRAAMVSMDWFALAGDFDSAYWEMITVWNRACDTQSNADDVSGADAHAACEQWAELAWDCQEHAEAVMGWIEDMFDFPAKEGE